MYIETKDSLLFLLFTPEEGGKGSSRSQEGLIEEPEACLPRRGRQCRKTKGDVLAEVESVWGKPT